MTAIMMQHNLRHEKQQALTLSLPAKTFAMTSNFLHTEEHAVYPGEYVPLPETEALLQTIKKPRKGSAKSITGMEENADCFKIEIPVPGVNHEDILIYVHDNILSVMLLHKDHRTFMQQLNVHEAKTDHFRRHVALPANADASFACAEYRNGVLQLHIPKSERPAQTKAIRIIVY